MLTPRAHLPRSRSCIPGQQSPCRLTAGEKWNAASALSNRARSVAGVKNALGAAAAAAADGQEEVCTATSETIFIFDWDDTLCPSSWLGLLGLTIDDPPPLDVQRKLAHLAHVAALTLQLAHRHGTVMIVTNAEDGWVDLSCQRFLPDLQQSIRNLRQLSARTRYEKSSCIDNPFLWKQKAFREEVGKYFSGCKANTRRNIISLGDSAHERLALMSITRVLPLGGSSLDVMRMPIGHFAKRGNLPAALRHCWTKSIKFIERPSIDELVQEHELLLESLKDVVDHQGDLDLCMSTDRSQSRVDDLHQSLYFSSSWRTLF